MTAKIPVRAVGISVDVSTVSPGFERNPLTRSDLRRDCAKPKKRPSFRSAKSNREVEDGGTFINRCLPAPNMCRMRIVQGKWPLCCNIAAMRCMHVAGQPQVDVSGDCRFRYDMISSVTKSRKAAMRFDCRNSSG